MGANPIPPHDLSSGEVNDIKAVGTFEQTQSTAQSDPITTIRAASVQDTRQWFTKAIGDATANQAPQEYATLRIGVGALKEWSEAQKDEWEATNDMIKEIEAGDWFTMGGLCEFNALPKYRRTRFRTSTGTLEYLKYFVMFFGTFNLTWVYLPTRRTTLAVIRSISQEGEREVRNILSSLKTGRPRLSWLDHPLHLGLLAHHEITQQLQAMIRRHQQNVINAQVLTGFHDYTNMARKQADLKSNDVTTASSDLVMSATTLGTAEEGSKGAIDCANFFLEENEHFAAIARRARLPVDDDLQHEVEQTAKRALRRAEALNHKAMLWQKKSSVVMQGLFNLIAQRDQTASIALAEATKRDSTSMKSIAAVTMIFLPGTFTASIFATPWFADSRAPVLTQTDHFWLYVVVTVPLTVLTLVCWAVWIRYARQIEMQKDAGKEPKVKGKWAEILRLFTKMRDIEGSADGEKKEGEEAALDEKAARGKRDRMRHVLPFYKDKGKAESGGGSQMEELNGP